MSHWPQLVYLALLAISIGRAAALHGKPETGRHNVFTLMTAIGISTWLLYMGGFWDGM